MRITAQGSLLTYKGNTPPRSGGGVRGKITGFSAASRKRLIKLFASLDTLGVKTSFVTLTFAGYPAPERAKAALWALMARWRRAYPEFSAVWRMEFQQRGSIHFHLICFNLPFIGQRGLQADWGQIAAGEIRKIRRVKAITTTKRPRLRRALYLVHIKAVRFKKELFAYLSKYVAKSDDDNVGKAKSLSLENDAYLHATHFDSTPEAFKYSRAGEVSPDRIIYPGRVWGYVNKENLPFGKVIEWRIGDPQIARYLRAAIRFYSRWRAGLSESGFLISSECYDMLFASMRFEAMGYDQRE